MPRNKQRSSERIFLFTLVDLLLQMLFVFFTLLLLVDETGSHARNELDKLRKIAGVRTPSELTEEWRRLSEAENACNKKQTDWEEKNRQHQEEQAKLEGENNNYKKRLGALGKPPCICESGSCDIENPRPHFIATFELHDDGVKVVDIPKSPEQSKLMGTADQVFSAENFRKQFVGFERAECRFYVRYSDKTNQTNKDGYKKWVSLLQSIFYAKSL